MPPPALHVGAPLATGHASPIPTPPFLPSSPHSSRHSGVHEYPRCNHRRIMHSNHPPPCMPSHNAYLKRSQHRACTPNYIDPRKSFKANTAQNNVQPRHTLILVLLQTTNCICVNNKMLVKHCRYMAARIKGQCLDPSVSRTRTKLIIQYNTQVARAGLVCLYMKVKTDQTLKLKKKVCWRPLVRQAAAAAAAAGERGAGGGGGGGRRWRGRARTDAGDGNNRQAEAKLRTPVCLRACVSVSVCLFV